MTYLGRVQALSAKYRGWIETILSADWEGWLQTVRGGILDVRSLPGFVALGNRAHPEGFLLYQIQHHQCQIVILDSRVRQVGHGTALLQAVQCTAQKMECQHLWLITSRENTLAIRFYQKYGFSISGYHAEGIRLSSRLQPSVHPLGPVGMRPPREVEMSLALPMEDRK